MVRSDSTLARAGWKLVARTAPRVRRRIGQEQLAIGMVEPRGGTSLDELTALVDWAELDCLLVGVARMALRGCGKGQAGLAAAGAVPGNFRCNLA